MKQGLICFSKLVSLSPQNPQIIYQLLFVFSYILFHSYDLWLNASLLDSGYINSKVFILEFLQINGLELGIVLASFLSAIYCYIKIFFLNKSTYMIELQERVVFPLLLLNVTQMLASSQSSFKSSQNSLSVFLRVFASFTLILTLILITVKNWHMNIRYPQNEQKGLNRLWKGQYFITLLKLSVTFIFILGFHQNRLISLFIISAINLCLNLSYKQKIIYEHPKVQYMNLVVQFFIWIPTLCSFLQFFGNSELSLWLTYVLGVIGFAWIALIKPKFMMVLLQQKYLKHIQQLSQNIRSYNFREGDQPKNFDTNVIYYLSIAKSIFLNKDQNQLRWSEGFIARLTKLMKKDTYSIQSIDYDVCVKFDSNFMRSMLDNHFIEVNERKQRIKRLRRTQRLTSDYDRYNLLNQNVEENIFISSGIDFYNNLCFVFANFLFKIQHCPSQVNLYICYNFSDSSNKMKHCLFYSYFKGLSQSKYFFQRTSFKMCYSHLLEKINGQTGENAKEVSQVAIKDECQIKKNNLAKRKYQTLGTCCLEEFQSYFNSNFNEVIKSSAIQARIISGFDKFAKNQQVYVNMHQLHQLYKIPEYLFVRNQLRRFIEEQIEDFTAISKCSLQSHNYVVFAYMKDCFLRQDPLMAYNEFAKRLNSNLQQNQKPDKKLNQLNISHKSKNLSCMVSIIADPDSIFKSSFKFNQLLEIDDKYQNDRQNDQKINKSTFSERKRKAGMHQVKLNNFLLPIWKQDHKKIINKKIIQSPINHFEKRYFMQSTKLTNIIEVKFKMYFNMLYEQDLLAILDIQYKTIKDLHIWDGQRQKLIFCHNKNPPKSQKLIQFNQKKGRAFNSVMDNSLKQKISQLTKALGYKSQQKNQRVQMFGKYYYIASDVVSVDQCWAEKMFKVNAKSVFNLEEPKLQNQMNNQQLRKEEKQRKFSINKNTYSFQKIFFFYFALFYLVSVPILGFLINIYQGSEKSILRQMSLQLNDKLLIQEMYVREDLYRAGDVGIFSNINQKNINLQLLSNQQKNVLQSRMADSVEIAVKKMKLRHHIDPFDIQKGARSQVFYNPYWIRGYNVSFQLKSYWSESKYIEAIKSFMILTQNVQLTTGITERNISLEVNLPKNKNRISVLKSRNNFKFLQDYLENKDYKQLPIYGVLAESDQRQRLIIEQLKQEREANLNMYISFVIGNCIIALFLVFYLIAKMVSKYNIAAMTSQIFVGKFQDNMKKLRSHISKLKKSEKKQINQSTTPAKTDNRQRNKTSKQLIRNLKSFKTYEMIVRQITHLDKSQKSITVKRKQIKQTLTDSKTKRQSSVSLQYYFARLIFPLTRVFVLIVFFMYVHSQNHNHIDAIQKYKQGLTQINDLDVTLLNSYASTLLISNYHDYSRSLNSFGTIEAFQKQFQTYLSKISSKDKIKLIKNLFVSHPQQDEIVSKILYGPICQDFRQEMQCPQTILQKSSSLYEKYSGIIKNLHLLYHHVSTANKTSQGILNTSQFQYMYIENYYNFKELMYISKRIKLISFQKLKQTLALGQDNQQNNMVRFLITLSLIIYLILEASVTLIGLGREARVIEEQFLRVGNYEMYREQSSQNDSYMKQVYKAQYLNLVNWLEQESI